MLPWIKITKPSEMEGFFITTSPYTAPDTCTLYFLQKDKQVVFYNYWSGHKMLLLPVISSQYLALLG